MNAHTITALLQTKRAMGAEFLHNTQRAAAFLSDFLPAQPGERQYNERHVLVRLLEAGVPQHLATQRACSDAELAALAQRSAASLLLDAHAVHQGVRVWYFVTRGLALGDASVEDVPLDVPTILGPAAQPPAPQPPQPPAQTAPPPQPQPPQQSPVPQPQQPPRARRRIAPVLATIAGTAAAVVALAYFLLPATWLNTAEKTPAAVAKTTPSAENTAPQAGRSISQTVQPLQSNQSAQAGDAAAALPGKQSRANNSTHENIQMGRAASLMAMASQGNIDMLRLLIASGVDVNAKYFDGTTALMEAAMNGHTEAVKFLLAAGADTNAKNASGDTALALARKYGNPHVAKLLRGANAQHSKTENSTPCTMAVPESPPKSLIYAARMGDAQEVACLLNAGVHADAADRHGNTALMDAAFHGRTNIAKLLLDAGANVNAKYKSDPKSEDFKLNDGFTALMNAAMQGHVETVKLLLAAGADVHAKTHNNTTTLMLAAHGGNLEIAKLLLDAGVDIHARAENGITALSQSTTIAMSQMLRAAGAQR